MPRRTIAALLGLVATADALVYEQVAFDSANVCWWSLAPPDPVCPVLKHENLTALLLDQSGKTSIDHQWQWQGGADCVGAYCLYANRGFAGGRGIAVITDAEGLAKVKQVGDLLHEYDISIADDADNVPFRTVRDEDGVEEEGEGQGEDVVVATSALKRGDPIMAHTPVLLVHRSFREETLLETQETLLNQAVKALPASTAKKLKHHISDGQTVHAMLAAHSFGVNLDGTSSSDDEDDTKKPASHARALHDGIFPEAASIRHNCRPNTASYVDPTTLMHIITAARPIAPGEALTLSRLDPLATHEERQAQAHTRWGSSSSGGNPGAGSSSSSSSSSSGCPCSHCSAAAADATAASDSATRLREISWIEAKLTDPTSSDVSTGLIAYHLGLHENEGLHCCLAKAYALAAANYNMLGYDKYATKYADLAMEAFTMEKGERAPEVREMAAFRKDVKRHATWRARVNNASRRAQSLAMMGVTEGSTAMPPPTSTLGPTNPAEFR